MFIIADQRVFQAENNPLYRFPVDGIVGRVAKRIGWKRIARSYPIHLLLLYPYSGIILIFDGILNDPQHVGLDGHAIFEGVHLKFQV